ncbi:hypothetical protein SEA_MASK_70 [Mycobacterium phage Mask]|nr:hypothetical protein SEA_RITA_68 [Mycobacterium phage Rita]UVT31501.1 hypothetical protein SEA_SEJANUS_69 [Mycobacterium phage Sejanus]UVT31603.1 hypothetical protein SEA_MASK_70 [Mycobacterium phage Mask]
MNATEDGFEPVGENPEVPARYDAGIASALAAIDRGAVLGIIAGADQVLATKQLAERQTQGINAVRKLHNENYFRNCGCCHESWPCATIRALDEAGA